MIVTRTPFRISFCGGGTDIPDYYRECGGCVVSTTIDKYTYLTLVNSFHRDKIILKYSTVEDVKDVEDIRHPIFREVLKSYGTSGVEINSTANIPSGTGLGSSSTFTVGLVNAVRTLYGKEVTKEILADEACDIEINRMGEPIGKQDQYAAAYGGLNFIRFNKDDTVDVEPIRLSAEEKKKLSDRLMMFYLGGTRSASNVLKQYKSNTPSNVGKKKILSDMAEKLKDELNNGNIDILGKVLDEGWKVKKTLAQGVSNGEIDEVYDLAMNNGAVGGKLLGAGGNGFMLFYAEERDQPALKKALSDYREVPFSFDDEGSKLIYNDEQ